MNVKISCLNGEVTAFLSGEIDHHTARDMRKNIDAQIESKNPKALILDFGNVKFMDSSGIGLIMGRYRLMHLMGGYVKVVNVPRNLQRIIDLSGVGVLGVLDIKKRT